MRWVLGDGSLRISCTNTEQEEAQEELDVDYKGDALDIGFNVQYLLDVLNNVTAKRSRSRSATPTRARSSPSGREGLQVRRDADADLAPYA